MKSRFSQKLFICGLILLVQFICLAQGDKGKGSALYEQGLSYEKQGKTKEAIKIYERVVTDTISAMESELEKEFAAKRASAEQEGWGDIIRRKMGENISTAIRSIGRLKEINPRKAASVEWETKSLILETFAEKKDENPAADKNLPNSHPVKITHLTKPDYPGEARSEGINGTVRLRALFLSNGKIGLAIPLNRLPGGLTESAVDAAKNIKFEPAMKDGKLITVFKVVEFSFWTTR